MSKANTPNGKPTEPTVEEMRYDSIMSVLQQIMDQQAEIMEKLDNLSRDTGDGFGRDFYE